MDSRTRTNAKYIAIVFLLLAGCRTVGPLYELTSSTAADISRVTLKNGKVIGFDADFGWYDKQAGTIEGTTADGQHVEYHLTELIKVETVRAYSIFAAVAAAIAVGGVVIYLLAKLLALV